MRISSAKKPLSRTTARNSFLINQLATPGLGSLMAGRWLAGAGQILLALIGFCFIVGWIFSFVWQTFQQLDSGGPTRSAAWMGETGAAAFAAAWLWSLFTSLRLLREARSNEAEGKT